MSVHLYIDQSGVVGVCLNRIHERQCWSCKCLYSGVNSPVGVLNVVGTDMIHIMSSQVFGICNLC